MEAVVVDGPVVVVDMDGPAARAGLVDTVMPAAGKQSCV